MYLHHITIEPTAIPPSKWRVRDVRKSPRAEVADEALRYCVALLEQASLLPHPEQHRIRGVDAALSVSIEGRGMIATVWALQGAPLVDVGVALHSRSAAGLWRAMGPIQGKRPPAPIVVAKIHPTLLLDMSATEWLGDFERCLGWAFSSMKEVAPHD